jgi:hypothetical protein
VTYPILNCGGSNGSPLFLRKKTSKKVFVIFAVTAVTYGVNALYFRELSCGSKVTAVTATTEKV